MSATEMATESGGGAGARVALPLNRLRTASRLSLGEFTAERSIGEEEGGVSVSKCPMVMTSRSAVSDSAGLSITLAAAAAGCGLGTRISGLVSGGILVVSETCSERVSEGIAGVAIEAEVVVSVVLVGAGDKSKETGRSSSSSDEEASRSDKEGRFSTSVQPSASFWRVAAEATATLMTRYNKI